MHARCSAYIIGQSNSVMREGFARAMRADGIIDIRGIKAVGSSASLLANFFLADLGDDAADYCVFDLNVYDRYLVYAGYYKLEHMYRYLDSAIVECRARGIEPIFALIPSPDFNERTRAVYDKHIEIAVSRKVFYFDGLDWLNERVRREGGSVADAFEDVNHLNPTHSSLFARALAQAVDMHHAGRDPSKTAVITSSEYLPVDVISLETFCAPELVRKAASSVIGLSLVEIKAGRSIKVHTGACERVCGLIVDTTSCTGSLAIRGRGSVIKNLAFSDDRVTLSFVARVVPLIGDVGDLNDSVDLSLAEVGLAPTEMTAGTRSREVPDGVVHLSHILVERKKRSVSYDLLPLQAAGRQEFNLATWVS